MSPPILSTPYATPAYATPTEELAANPLRNYHRRRRRLVSNFFCSIKLTIQLFMKAITLLLCCIMLTVQQNSAKRTRKSPSPTAQQPPSSKSSFWQSTPHTASDSNTGVNYYAILNLPTTATLQDVKRARRQLALGCHPDKLIVNGESVQSKGSDPAPSRPRKNSNPVDFITVQEAYEILSDPIERTRYDQALSLNIPYRRLRSKALFPSKDDSNAGSYLHNSNSCHRGIPSQGNARYGSSLLHRIVSSSVLTRATSSPSMLIEPAVGGDAIDEPLLRKSHPVNVGASKIRLEQSDADSKLSSLGMEGSPIKSYAPSTSTYTHPGAAQNAISVRGWDTRVSSFLSWVVMFTIFLVITPIRVVLGLAVSVTGISGQAAPKHIDYNTLGCKNQDRTTAPSEVVSGISKHTVTTSSTSRTTTSVAHG